MKLLTVADCHGNLMYQDLIARKGLAENLDYDIPDVVLYLGDNTLLDIETIQMWLENRNISVPQYGVYGNHDSPSLLSKSNVTSLHLNAVDIQGNIFGGFGGSYKYKNSPYLYTHQESVCLLQQMKFCNIFVTHSNPQFRTTETVDVTPEPKGLIEKIKCSIVPQSPVYEEQPQPFVEKAHAGLIGIGDYIEINCPSYHFHGHLHERTKYIHGSTTIRSCYGVELIII